LHITASDRAIIEWENFSIQRGELARFDLPAKESSVLNRVTGGSVSHLLGKLESNGSVYLVNPAGVVIGKEGMVNTMSFVVSTLDILNDQFLQQTELVFKGDSQAAIVNEGTIRAGKDVVLMGYKIDNLGIVEAPAGGLKVGSGGHIVFKPDAKERLFILPTALDGRLNEENLYELAINHAGTADALNIEIDGGSRVVLVSGQMKGDSVSILGEQVGLIDQGSIEVRGGTVILGNRETSYVYVGPEVSITADALEEGNGGKVVVWGEKAAAFYGRITARGGEKSGNGGFVEISSMGVLMPSGHVDTSAPFGKVGTLLFDPAQVTISMAATSPGVTPTSPAPPCPLPAQDYMFGAVMMPNINTMDLQNYLSCNDVTINASTSGGDAVSSITINNALSWVPANPMVPTKLTLIADTIQFNNGIQSAQAGYSPTTVVMDIQATNVIIGDPAHSLGTVAGVFAVSGQINVTSPGSLSIYGGMAGNSGQIFADTVQLNTGSLTMEAGSTANSFSRISVSYNLNATFTGDITFTADGDSAGFVKNSMVPGGVTATGNGTNIVTMTGGPGAAGQALIVLAEGDINFTNFGNLFITGGSSAMDGNSGFAVQGGSGSCTISAANITFTGGSAPSGMGVLNNALIFTQDGTLSVTATGAQGIILNGGTNNNCAANFAALGTGSVQISTTNLIMNASNSLGVVNAGAGVRANNGNVTVLASGDIQLNGSDMAINSGASIFANGVGQTCIAMANNISLKSGMVAGASAVLASDGDLFLTAAGSLTLTGGIDPPGSAFIAAGGGGAGALDLHVGGDVICHANGGAAILLNQGVGPVQITGGGKCELISFGGGPASIVSAFGPLTATFAGDVAIQAGTTFPFIGDLSAGLQAAGGGGSGDLTVSAANVSITGGSGMFAIAGLITSSLMMPTGDGSINLSASGSTGITLNGGSASIAFGVIGVFGASPTNNIDITAPGGSLVINGSSTPAIFGADAGIVNNSGGHIVDPAGVDIILFGTSSGFAFISASSTEELLLRAGRNISVNDFGSITNSGTGGITLVADNSFPTPPGFGSGAFFTTPNATIMTPGPLRIFTSQQPNNGIQSSLNGTAFNAGTQFVNSSQEQWGAYYPNAFGGFPFTIFYKDISISGNVVPNFLMAVTEALWNWEWYDYAAWDTIPWSVSYDRDKYRKNQNLRDKDFDTFRKLYRNYHTLYMR
jgi:filamentous hemagglutinin family protein